MLKLISQDIKIKNINDYRILVNNKQDQSVDSESSQISNLTIVEIHENKYIKKKNQENPFINLYFEDNFLNVKKTLNILSSNNRKIFSILKENYSALQKYSLELQGNFFLKENNERNLINFIEEIKFLDKKYNNMKYEMNPFSPTQRDKIVCKRMNFFDIEIKNNNNKNNTNDNKNNIYIKNNNNINVPDSFTRHSNICNISSFFNNPNLQYNNEMNVDELIDDLENKLSFIKLQNAQTIERLDLLTDDIAINEKFNKVIIFQKIYLLKKIYFNTIHYI